MISLHEKGYACFREGFFLHADIGIELWGKCDLCLLFRFPFLSEYVFHTYCFR